MPDRNLCPIGASTASRDEALHALAELRAVVSKMDVGVALAVPGFAKAWVRTGLVLGDEAMIAAVQSAAPIIALPAE